MSQVTDILLLGSCIDANDKDYAGRPSGMARGILRIQEWLREHGHGPLKEIGDHAGGGKHFQADVWAGAYNAFDTEGFLAEVAACEWFLPQTMMLLIQEEPDEHGFTVFRLNETFPWQVAIYKGPETQSPALHFDVDDVLTP